ncbi:DNA-binding LacI/PurR family transcriptional regulator [Algoriphagus sp. 4150]|nr:DNA-binding LacI/PurR family transcriptional regulator [Algoriphagus sp. 4150]
MLHIPSDLSIMGYADEPISTYLEHAEKRL